MVGIVSVTDTQTRPGAAIKKGNTTQELLDDLNERGYVLSVNAETGRLHINEGHPPITPVIWHAIQANYKKLVRLLSPDVTDDDSSPGPTIRKDNTDYSKVVDLAPKRGEELEQAIADHAAAQRLGRERAKANAPEGADGIDVM